MTWSSHHVHFRTRSYIQLTPSCNIYQDWNFIKSLACFLSIHFRVHISLSGTVCLDDWTCINPRVAYRVWCLTDSSQIPRRLIRPLYKPAISTPDRHINTVTYHWHSVESFCKTQTRLYYTSALHWSTFTSFITRHSVGLICDVAKWYNGHRLLVEFTLCSSAGIFHR